MIEFKGKGFLGRTDDGTMVYVKIEVSTLQGEHQTTDHRYVTDIPRISISGHYFTPRSPGARIGLRPDIDGGGQIRETLTDITVPDIYFTREDITRIDHLWEYWHLNDMRPGCAHQTPVWRDGRYGREYDLDNTPVCPLSGYHFGSAWLADVPPVSVLTELRELADELDGNTGLRDVN